MLSDILLNVVGLLIRFWWLSATPVSDHQMIYTGFILLVGLIRSVSTVSLTKAKIISSILLWTRRAIIVNLWFTNGRLAVFYLLLISAVSFHPLQKRPLYMKLSFHLDGFKRTQPSSGSVEEE